MKKTENLNFILELRFYGYWECFFIHDVGERC